MYRIRVGTGDGAVAVAHPTAKAAMETLRRAEEEGQEDIAIYTREGRNLTRADLIEIAESEA